MGGLDDPILGSKLQFPECISGVYCQIVNNQSTHCVAISNLYAKDDKVGIYDSLFLVPSMAHQMQAASILMQLVLNMKIFLVLLFILFDHILKCL